MNSQNAFRRGVHAGLPIGLGYFSVSLSFGILAVSYGFTWWQAALISALTVTSAGQFAGIHTMLHPGQYLAMVISQLTINVRYSMMAVSLSQKVENGFGKAARWLLGFFITDEIFAVAAGEKQLTKPFFAGLAVLPWLGWTLGTLAGALAGSILPQSLVSAMCIALYGMFVAIVVPVAKKEKPVLFVVVLAMVFSCLLTWLPGLKEISSGIAVSLCAVAAAAIGAAVFPVKEEVA